MSDPCHLDQQPCEQYRLSPIGRELPYPREARFLLIEDKGDCGFDFVEPGVVWIVGLDDGNFSELAAAVLGGAIDVTACNTFVPRELPIVGPEREPARLQSYVQSALDRIKELGCTYITSGYLLVRLVDHPHFKLLADSYHMDEVGEPVSTLQKVYPALDHVHTADTGRRRPGAGEYDHMTLFRALKEVGYAGGVSVECRWDDFDNEAPLAASHLRRAWEAVKE